MILRKKKKNVYLKLQVASKSFQTLGNCTRPIQVSLWTTLHNPLNSRFLNALINGIDIKLVGSNLMYLYAPYIGY